MRSTALAVCAAAIVFAPATAGAQVGLRDDPAATGVALAGPDVLVARDDGAAQVLAVPRTGGPARTLLSVASARVEWPESVSFSASDQRVAVIVAMERSRGRTVGWRVYSGPPAGPLSIVRRARALGTAGWIPGLVDVDGDRMLLVETLGWSVADIRAYVFAPAFGFVPIAWAKESFVPLAIAGEYAAVFATRPGRLAVVELATGVERVAVPVPRSQTRDFDLAADGRLVVATSAGIMTARPGEAPAALPDTKGLEFPHFAGEEIVALDDRRLVAVSPRRSLGPPSRVWTAIAADAAGVAWLTNGCVRYSPATPAADPCPSTEIGLYAIAGSRLRGRHVRVPVDCVAAPTGTCRGTVFGKAGRRVVARGRFAIPVDTEQRVRMRVTRRAAARFRRKGWGSLIIGARVPDGRVGAGADGSAELGVEVR